MDMLKEKLQQEMKEAMKAHEELRLSVLRMLLSAIHNREIEKKINPTRSETHNASPVPQAEQTSNGARGGRELTDQEVLAAIRSEVKKRKDAIGEFEKGGRKDLADKEAAEMKILEVYLPAEMPEAELGKIIKQVFADLGIQKPFDTAQGKDFGKIMGTVMQRIKGQVSGDRVSRAVKIQLDNIQDK